MTVARRYRDSAEAILRRHKHIANIIKCFRVYDSHKYRNSERHRGKKKKCRGIFVTGKLLQFFIHDLTARQVLARAQCALVHRLCSSREIYKFVVNATRRCNREDAKCKMRADARWIERYFFGEPALYSASRYTFVSQ